MTDQQTPPTEASFFTSIRRWGITRGDSRVLGGVASGIAERLGWSLGWTRVGVAAVALLTHGLGLLAYAAAWALLPDRQGRIIAQDFGRGVPNVGALIVIGILTVIGLIGLSDAGSPWAWGAGGWPGDFELGGPLRAIAAVLAVLIPLAIVGGVIALIVVLARRDRDRTGGSGGSAPRPDGTPPVYAVPPAWAAERQRQRAEAAAYAAEAGAAAGAAATVAGAQAAQAARAAEQAAQEAAQAASQAASQAATQAVPQWGPAPAGGAPVPPAAPYAAPRPPRPPRVPGPGVAFWLLTLAWLVLSGAGTAWATWQDRIVVHPLIAWFALFVTGLGVILMLVALTGRRLGFLAFLSALLLVPVTAMIVEADEIRDGWADRYFPEVHVERDGDQVTRIEIGDGSITIGEDGVTIGEDGIVIGSPPPVESDASAAPEPSGEAEAEPGTEAVEVDAVAELEDTYALLFVPSACTDDVSVEADGSSRGLISTRGLEGERTVKPSAHVTTLRVDEGTGVAMELADDEAVRLVWADRGFACDVAPGESFAALSLGDPLVTVDPTAEVQYIVIEEVAS
ncbi:PspC domain-containing protein [Demequina rhizosphaerae]|uniref:PspC domain-containing protein n=1 Tax=Demequina rhizosphaerae TaxID=1638985 RepID=UPI0007824712|nr:PspC domain-containing protein [Demequina rhizosphaerae]